MELVEAIISNHQEIWAVRKMSSNGPQEKRKRMKQYLNLTVHNLLKKLNLKINKEKLKIMQLLNIQNTIKFVGLDIKKLFTEKGTRTIYLILQSKYPAYLNMEGQESLKEEKRHQIKWTSTNIITFFLIVNSNQETSTKFDSCQMQNMIYG